MLWVQCNGILQHCNMQYALHILHCSPLQHAVHWAYHLGVLQSYTNISDAMKSNALCTGTFCTGALCTGALCTGALCTGALSRGWCAVPPDVRQQRPPDCPAALTHCRRCCYHPEETEFNFEDFFLWSLIWVKLWRLFLTRNLEGPPGPDSYFG